MSIKNDIDEIIKEWKTSSKWFKVVVVISALMTLSSLASLADTVFAWKGFILDGIEFYHAWVVKLIKKIFSFLNLKLTTTAINYLILILLYVGSSIRLINYMLYPTESKITSSLTIFGVFGSLIVISLLFLEGAYLDSIFGFLAFLCLIAFLVTIIDLKKEKKELIIFVGPTLFSIVTILILAAINAGLTR